MMNDFLMYLLKSACWLTGFTLVYMIFLKNERFFTLKRVFLLTGIIVSLGFPLINIHYHVMLPIPQDTSLLLPQEPLPTIIGADQDETGITDFRIVMLSLYLAGIVFISSRMIWQTIRLYKTINSNKKDIKESAIVVRSSDYAESFSFINYVFINPSVSEHEAAEILNHELVHVKQKHWLDLITVELLRILQWANPFAWIYTGFIRLNHEYLADEVALRRSANPALYRAALINQLFEAPVISLSNSFNNSLNNKRFEMMKKIITSPYRKLKVLLVLPVFAVIFYAFAIPSYQYFQPDNATGPEKINTQQETVQKQTHPLIIIDGKETTLESTVGINPDSIATIDVLKDEPSLKGYGEKGRNGVILITMKKDQTAPIASTEKVKTIREVKGTVSREDGSPFSNAAILVTGTQARSNSDESGNFTLTDVPKNSRIIISGSGYITQLLKPVAKLAVQMKKDPDYKETGFTSTNNFLAVINGNVSDKPFSEIRNSIQPDQIATISVFKGEEAVKKYGEKARNGVVAIITKDKAKEMGVTVPFRRNKPEDFPTFTGNSNKNFTRWVLDQLKYPAEAVQKGIQGRVSASLVVQADGSVSNVRVTGDPLLTQAVADLVNSSPKWEPAVNAEARQPYNTSVNLKFQLPDKILSDEVFIVVEQMPMYPGGETALLEQIRNNIKYPQDALDQKIEGRVIVRFIVTSSGTVEGATVLKGVHPSLDAEALRVVSSLATFIPGSQGGKPVDVWYMVPVNFTLLGKDSNLSQPSTTGETPYINVDQMPEYPGGDGEMLKFIAENTKYPEEAKKLKIQGKVIVRCAVKKDGTVDRVSVIKGIDPLLDNEAIMVVSLLKGFRPGMQGGVAVDTWYMIPITFTLK